MTFELGGVTVYLAPPDLGHWQIGYQYTRTNQITVFVNEAREPVRSEHTVSRGLSIIFPITYVCLTWQRPQSLFPQRQRGPLQLKWGHEWKRSVEWYATFGFWTNLRARRLLVFFGPSWLVIEPRRSAA